MSTYRSLGRLSDLAAQLPGMTEFLQAQSELDLSFLERTHVQHWRVWDGFEGLRIELALALEGELILSLPGLSVVSFALGANVPGYTFLRGAATIGARSRLDLCNLAVTLRLDQPWLVPVALEPGATVPETVEIEVHGSFSIDSDLNVRPRLNFFSIPPFTVGQTGLILGLENCQLDLSTTETPPALLALDFDESFRGIYAERAKLYWLPQAVFDGLPGVRLDFTHVAVGDAGVSFEVSQTWIVEHDGQAILPTTELAGYLFDEGWGLAIERLQGSVRHNVPYSFFATGYLQVPLLQTVLMAEFGLRPRNAETYETSLSVRKTEGPPIELAIGAATITLANFSLTGILAEDGFALAGHLSGGIDLPGFSLEVEQAAASLSHTPTADLLELQLGAVQFGPLGEVESAMLRLHSVVDDAGQRQFSLTMEAGFSWADLHARLPLSDLPDVFPLPPDEARITAYLHWETAPSNRLELRFSAAVSDPDVLWRFVPTEYRPEVRQAEFEFSATYDSAADFQGSATDSSFQGDIAVALSLRLPPLPGMELLHIDTGDADGWIDARLTARTQTDPDTGESSQALQMEIGHPLATDFNLPGLAQDPPPLHAAINRVNLDLSATSDIEGTFTLEGDFTLRPVMPPPQLPLAVHLGRLLSGIATDGMKGTVKFDLAVRDERAMMTMAAVFENTGLSVDLFELISGLSGGRAEPARTDRVGEPVPLNTTVGFDFRRIALRIGSLAADDDAGDFQVELTGLGHVAGLAAELFVSLADEGLQVGIRGEEDPATGGWSTDLPIRLPVIPLTVAKLTRFESLSWNGEAYQAERRQAVAAARGLSAADLETTTDPQLLMDLAGIEVERGLLEQIKLVRERLAVAARDPFIQDWIKPVLEAFEQTTAYINEDVDVTLRLEGFALSIPFGDPRDLAVEGSVLIFAAADSPMQAVLSEGIRLTAGLSPDMIFFEAQGPGEPIPIPSFGRYKDGFVRLGTVRIGYGYTSNSFNLLIDGSVSPPPALINDADTSQSLGAGIRMPEQTSLYFRLGLIPIPGPIPAVPVFDFNLDLRAPDSLPLVSATTCRPYWDGLQLNVPGVVRADVKHLAISPMFSGLPIPHYRFDGDLMIGDDTNGVTLIIDNYLWLAGLLVGSAPMPVPLLADPSLPYFENLCLNLRAAGLKLNLNLRHPFPTFTPMVVLEVLGLLADSSFELDPNGELANIIRVAVEDVTIDIPDWSQRIFPELRGLLPKPSDVVLNIANLAPAVQAVVGAIKTALETAADVGSDINHAVNRLLAVGRPLLSPHEVLQVLPPEYRKFRTGASFAGFESRCALVFLSPEQAVEEFHRRDNPPPAISAQPAAFGRAGADVGLPAPAINRAGERRPSYDNLLAGREFQDFTADDLSALPQTAKAALVIGANVKVFEGQRFRFLGYLCEDGSFALVTADRIRLLQLTVAGMPVSLPLEFDGRLILSGRARRDGMHGSIQTRAFGAWNVIPGIVRLAVGSKEKPASLKIFSNGQFQTAGKAVLIFGKGATRIDVDADISHTHCLVRGKLRYAAGSLNGRKLIDLNLDCQGRIGPGRRFDIGGAGDLAILGHSLTAVRGRLTESGAEVQGALHLKELELGMLDLNRDVFELRMDVQGRVDLNKRRRPAFAFEGRADLKIFDARIIGRGGLRCRPKPGGSALEASIAGQLFWQAREWANGRVTLSDTGVTIAGATSLALDLTPPEIANVQVANLFLKLNLQGQFTLGSNGQLAAHARLGGDWQLAVQFPGANQKQRQAFALAMQSFQVTAGATLNQKLLEVRGFRLFPHAGSGFTLKVPAFSVTPSGSNHFRIRYDVHRIAGVNVTVPLLPVIHEVGDPCAWHGVAEQVEGFKSVNIATSYTVNIGEKTIQLPTTLDFDVLLVWDEAQRRFALKIEPR